MQTTNLHGKCHAFLSVRKNKMKSYGPDTYYLRDKQEFELGLTNYTTSTVVAMISMNGKAISTSGLVIKPGQTVFLERFIDDSRKFLFETYTIDNTPEGLKAIQNNGDVEIKFYKEKEPTIPISYTVTNTGTDWFNCTNTGTTSSCFYGATTSGYGGQHVNSVSKGLKSRGASGQGASMDMMSMFPDTKLDEKFRETGRVEKGSNSNQRFTNYSGEFESWAFQTTSLKLLPIKYKPVEISELATYCVSCGTKNKKGNYRFCPKCGTKY